MDVQEDNKSLMALSSTEVENFSTPLADDVSEEWEVHVKREPLDADEEGEEVDTQHPSTYSRRAHFQGSYESSRLNCYNEYENSNQDIEKVLKVEFELEFVKKECEDVKEEYDQENSTLDGWDEDSSTGVELGTEVDQSKFLQRENQEFLPISEDSKFEVEQHKISNPSKDICGTPVAPGTATCCKNLKNHSDRPFSCDICHRKFSRKIHLQTHLNTHTGNKPFSCDICHHKFTVKTSLTMHLRIHTGEKPYSCSVCERQFTVKSNLQAHLKIHSGETPFGCDVCSRRFSVKANLNKHLKTHAIEKPFGCDVCDRKFPTKSSLNKHLKIHSSDKPFGCDICPRSFAIQGSLKKHLATHADEKPFGCNTCDRRFHHKSDLHRHLKIHTDDKPFVCPVCQRKFLLKANLKKHLKIHSGDKPYSCHICQRKFLRKSYVKEHFARVHTPAVSLDGVISAESGRTGVPLQS